MATFGAALFGMWVRTILPERHFDADSRDTVKLGIGLVATMTALVLGLATASAKNSFDAVDGAVKQAATQVLALDRLLARYGSETAEIRRTMQRSLGARIDMIWPPSSRQQRSLDPATAGIAVRIEGVAESIRALKPNDDSQRALQIRALDLIETLLAARWLVIAITGASITLPFLAILLFWLMMTFTSFGLFAPRNVMVFVVLFVCALSVGSAVFLVLEMDGPFDGLIRVSSDPLRYAHAHMNQ